MELAGSARRARKSRRHANLGELCAEPNCGEGRIESAKRLRPAAGSTGPEDGDHDARGGGQKPGAAGLPTVVISF